ncbi:MAG: serine/threonine protein phosphatase [Chloroflexia bacterium]|nr:serine/threonine protein phosphatase [Chloroflexia bacterium]
MTSFSINNELKTYLKVKKPKQGRRFVIPDIHGHFDEFKAVLDKISLTKSDQLFLLGDYIDRGPKVKELLDEIILLIENGYSVFPLRGNHEDMCWQAHLKDYDEETLKLPGYKWGKDIIDGARKIFPEYVSLISQLPYYYELDNFFIVHAGFDFSAPAPFTEYKSMLWNCNTSEDIKHLNGKTLIHGHVKRPINEIRNSIKNRTQIIALDNSVYTKNSNEYGNLLCLNLDSFELFVQKSA